MVTNNSPATSAVLGTRLAPWPRRFLTAEVARLAAAPSRCRGDVRRANRLRRVGVSGSPGARLVAGLGIRAQGLGGDLREVIVAGRRRRLYGVVLIGMALLLAGCIPAAPAPHPPAPRRRAPVQPGSAESVRPVGKGEFLASCTLANRATVDPIVAPGSTTFWHRHDFFGNVTTGPTRRSTRCSARAAPCVTAFDTAAYWVPTSSHDGTPCIRTSPTSSTG